MVYQKNERFVMIEVEEGDLLVGHQEVFVAGLHTRPGKSFRDAIPKTEHEEEGRP